MSQAEAQISQPHRLRDGFLRFCKHPASILVWFCLFSLIIKEQYPFSHYPMYSGWSSRTHYFYIADKDGPIQAKTVFKVSVPRIKKMYGGNNGTLDKVLEAQRKSTGNKKYELVEADYAEAGRALLEKLRNGVPKKRLEGQMKDYARTPLKHPDGSPVLVKDVVARDLTLMRVEIERRGGEFLTSEKPVVTSDADNNIVPNPH